MKKIKLSIITINYNNQNGLRNTIESVVTQTFCDYEYIIIDGGSTDGSVEVIKDNASNIDYWVSEKDKGIYHAMNKGVLAAHGDYTLFLNSGDVLRANSTLEEIFRYNIDTDFVFGSLKTQLGQDISIPENLTMEYFLHCSPPHPATLIKRTLFEVHPYDERYRVAGDWEFFLFHLIKNNASYKKLKVCFAIFDLTGISSLHLICDNSLKKDAVNSILLPRVREDYRIFMGQEDEYHRLFYIASNSKVRSILYILSVIVLKVLMINKGWIKTFKLRRI